MHKGHACRKNIQSKAMAIKTINDEVTATINSK